VNQVSPRSIAPLRRMLAALLFAAGLLFAPRAALAGGTIDQVSPNTGAGFFFGLGTTWQQQIKAGIPGQLVAISIEVTGAVGNTLNVVIRRGATWSTQPALFQQLVTKIGAATTILIDTTAAPLFFATNEIFVLEIQGTSTSLALSGNYAAPPAQPLYTEPLFQDGTPGPLGFRLAFTTYVGPCTVNAQCDDQNLCTTDTCTLATGLCSHANNALSCTDGDSCTQNDVCSAGACVPGAAVKCAALDGCHAVGVCNPMSGVCSNPNKPDNSACSDANACTQTDTCQAGVCTGQSPVVCPAPDACHSAGTCNIATGMCSNPAKPDGSACNDSNACTPTDICQAGVCTGQNPVVCPAPDACHSAGLCDTVTGKCSNPAKPDGSSCDDGNGCTQSDICQAGACTGQNPVVCAPANDCQIPGVCDPTVGTCTNTAKPDGTTCEDGTACTQGDICQAGACLSGAAVTCTALDACHDVGTCDAKSGLCSNPAKDEGSSCDDGTACTQGDTCIAGTCTSGPPVVCAALDKCHEVGTCDTATGQCSNPLKDINCSAKTDCEQNGVCDPQSGLCINAAKPDGIPCGTGICIAGTCSDEAGNTTSVTSSTSSGGTSTTGSTGTSASTGVGGSGAGGAGGAGMGGASGGTGVGGSSATGTSSPSATSTTSGGDGTLSPAGGCGCSTPGTEPARAPWLLLGLLLPALRRRRKASRLAA
jgi:MYXO-CTERM domain-containing protein